ncbi:hypothetical protein A5320_17855 [Rheinheimera sp. SA_1]|uniref:beta-ribofuranosylaminobenzene 5'-phosphate synthase family protein n=1 Tax=Rheinheimera sp. SA_1 TaxID=1827365 RepID=UPI0008021707|nr:beta-ribofuranosylaminobenzene 5'-phosphate synthase family protein [Rheinheimera sp. SA_1]OBP13777.1 hypothetical protein A5320_17855 [Rheinheimera sp. SA_1]
MLTINIPSRIHITLIAMHECDLRKNGGIGFSIQNMGAQAKFYTSQENNVTIENRKENCKKSMEIENILNNICKFMNLNKFVEIHVSNLPDFHSGLGSGTSLILACIEGLLIINDVTYEDRDLINLSNRGGTSGIGIQTYFTGGFILDVGVNSNNTRHLPSSYAENISQLPSVIHRSPMPAWKVGVVIPDVFSKIDGEIEMNFFNRVCPIQKNEALEACYLSVFGVTAAIVDNNYNSFVKSISRIQKTRWKNEEINEHSLASQQIEYLLHLGADCAGMSSVGPALYFFAKNISEIKSNFIDRYGGYGFVSDMNNTGRTVCLN